MGKDEWWVLFQAHETFFLLSFCFFFICALFLIHEKKRFVLLPLSPWERGPGGEGLLAGGERSFSQLYAFCLAFRQADR